MEVEVKPGTYIVAVSGGVDSVVLLHMLRRQKLLSLVVAHFDHGIRADSAADRQFVQSLAEKYGLPFEYEKGRLGAGASEALAREARYKFLRKVKENYGADAIITAHHQDDLIETAIINLLRGTGRKGLSSLSSRGDIIRPLLSFPKKDLVQYAKSRRLDWREDSTNSDTKYLRNYVRHVIVPKISASQREKLLHIISSQRSVNTELDKLLAHKLEPTIDKKWFAALPYAEASEVMAAWLRAQDVHEFERKTIERAVVGAKTATPGRRIAVKKGLAIEVGKEKLALIVLADGRPSRKK
ncbi:MAG TPA: tRNA lysidine(34) synthetase TilS [Candidatus Saccharimonadales bacterium]|nr:tRNA lysidine(34) synthetase TilS [Candidatus Saccharimonadales bacterium]